MSKTRKYFKNFSTNNRRDCTKKNDIRTSFSQGKTQESLRVKLRKYKMSETVSHCTVGEVFINI